MQKIIERNVVLYSKALQKALFKGKKLEGYYKLNYINDKEKYILFDSVGEYKVYCKLLKIFPEYKDFKIFVHYKIKKPYLNWKVDFCISANTVQSQIELKSFCAKFNIIPVKNSILIEFKVIPDKRFIAIIKLLAGVYPAIYSSLLVITENSYLPEIKFKDPITGKFKTKTVYKAREIQSYDNSI